MPPPAPRGSSCTTPRAATRSRCAAAAAAWRGTAGAATTSAGADTVAYDVSGLTATIEFKPLLDDATWARGPNYHLAPGATVEIWPHFTESTGTVETLIPSFHSSHVADDRPIYAYLPASYAENTDAHYPVVYLHDGQNLWAARPDLAFSGTWNVDTAFDTAAEQGTCSSATVTGWGAQPLGSSATLCTGDADCDSGSCRTFPEADRDRHRQHREPDQRVHADHRSGTTRTAAAPTAISR